MNIRPATIADAEFLKKMLYEAAAWNPDWPLEQVIEALRVGCVRMRDGAMYPTQVQLVASMNPCSVEISTPSWESPDDTSASARSALKGKLKFVLVVVSMPRSLARRINSGMLLFSSGSPQLCNSTSNR